MGDRWRTVEALYHATLALTEEDRLTFLERACGSDVALREDVESLVAQSSDAAALDRVVTSAAVRIVEEATRRSSDG